jgi:uncharacterized protein
MHTDPDPPLSASPLKRALLITGGLLALGAGIAGLILPGMPGTPLLLVATWLFSLSNRRLYNWMLDNRWFGRGLRDYRAGLGIPLGTKIVAAVTASTVIVCSVVFALESWWARAAILALGIYGVGFVLTRPTRRRDLDAVRPLRSRSAPDRPDRCAGARRR